MLRQDKSVEEKQKSQTDPLGALERRKAASRRTAWIIGGIAAFFFIASLVHGHFVGISNWVPPGH